MKVRALIDHHSKIPAWLEWRITNPYKHFRLHEIDANHTWAPIGWQFEKDIDILVLPRLIVERGDRDRVLEWFNSIKANGTKLVYECDDDIFSEFYVSQLSSVYWNPNKPIEMLPPLLDELEHRRQNAIWTMLQCDAVTVSSKSLGVYVQTLTSAPVYVLENAIDIEKFEAGLKTPIRNNDYVFIGWAGGRRSENDLEQMFEAWIKLLEQRDNVRFVIAGWTPAIVKQNKAFLGKLVGLPWKETDNYASNYQVDIGCCSVNDNPFGHRKSPIKAFEYGLAGASVVASEVVYAEEPIIMIAKDVDEWLMLLKHQVDDSIFRKVHAEIYNKHVKSYHDLKYNWVAWYKVYEEIINGSKNLVLSETRTTN